MVREIIKQANAPMRADILGLLIIVMVSLLTVLTLVGLWAYVSAGEDSWSGGPFIHGDWLINVHGPLVRRGLLGSLVLMTSDAIGVNAIPMLTAIMSLLFIGFAGLTLWLLLMLQERTIAILLLASPALPLIFWAAVPYSAFKKELLIYCAIAVLVFAAQTRRDHLLVVSVMLFALCALGHELALLWLPIFLTILFLAARNEQLSHTRIAAATLVAVTAATTAWHLTFQTVEDPSLICDQLVERNIAARICDGSIVYLGNNAEAARDHVLSFAAGAPQWHFELAYLFSLLPLLMCAWLSHARYFAIAAVLLCGLPFLPLYFIAVDWGRWMAFHVVSATFLLIYLFLSDRLRLRRSPPVWLALALLASAMLWAPSTNMEVRRGVAANAFANVLR